MRLDPMAPDEMEPDLRAFHEEMAEDIRAGFKGFTSFDERGALVGPSNPMLHYPQWGRAAWHLTMALANNAKLPPNVREVVILVIGGSTGAAYELYAHTRTAAAAGLDAAKISTIVAGGRPHDLSDKEAAAFDLASSLSRRGVVAEATWNRACKVLGADGAAEAVFLAGSYLMTCTILNGFDIPVPSDAPGGVL